MPFPIRSTWTAKDFEGIFGTTGGYWSKLKADLAAHKTLDAKDKAGLFDDYCNIGEFLVNESRVFKALEALEKKLRLLVSEAASNTPRNLLAARFSAPRPPGANPGNQKAIFKTHKLLSGALSEAELLFGFNNAQAQVSTHSQSLQFDVQKKVWEQKSSSNKANLPAGVPTVVGDLSGLDFNNVLLRHGYQFKDVAAGFRHGEYSHRLQWFAICSAAANNGLALKNTPLQIFKSMGFMLAKADGTLPTWSRTLYLYVWHVLFDAGKSERDALTQNTVAYTEGTFTSPEVLTARLIDPATAPSNTQDVSSLHYLRTLVSARYHKRFLEGPQEPRERDYHAKARDRFAADKVSGVLSTFPFDLRDQATPQQKFGEAPLLIWYVNT
jgi:hypothetical protein